MSESPDSNLAPPVFNRDDVEIMERKPLYRGFFHADEVILRHRQFTNGEWGEPMSREIVYRPRAVGVLLYDPRRDELALVEQFRIGALRDESGPWCLEVVAGMMEEGETAEEVARRELVEEAGIHEVELRYIGNYRASPGGCDEKLYLYIGLCDLTDAGGVFGLPEEHEDIKTHVLSAERVLDSLYTGRWNNPAALITLQWLAMNRQQLMQEV